MLPKIIIDWQRNKQGITQSTITPQQLNYQPRGSIISIRPHREMRGQSFIRRSIKRRTPTFKKKHLEVVEECSECGNVKNFKECDGNRDVNIFSSGTRSDTLDPSSSERTTRPTNLKEMPWLSAIQCHGDMVKFRCDGNLDVKTIKFTTTLTRSSSF